MGQISYRIQKICLLCALACFLNWFKIKKKVLRVLLHWKWKVSTKSIMFMISVWAVSQ